MREKSQPIIEAQEVHKMYRSGQLRVEALRKIDMIVAKGEMVAIMGPSGCGKTTLLNCLAGLDTIDEGNVFIQGDNLRDLTDNQRTTYRARHMGFVFQDFNLLPMLSAVENVELPMLVSKVSTKKARSRALEFLDRVGLADRLLCLFNREYGQTLVVVTHALEVGQRANRIIRMQDGNIV